MPMRLPPDVLAATEQPRITFLHMSNDSGEMDPLRGELRPAGPVKLTLTESHRPGVTIIGVRGELDLLTAPKVAAQLDRAVRGGHDDIVVDLRETVFVDSAGLHILLMAKRRLARLSRQFTVVSASGPVRRVLELSRLTDTLGVVDRLDDAGTDDPGHCAG